MGVLRDRINIFFGCDVAPTLSVQYLLNCARNCIHFTDRGNTYSGCNESCKGGYIMGALLFAQMVGVPKEDDFVYTSNAGCQGKGECSKKGCPGINETMYTCDSVYSLTLDRSLFRQINTSGNLRETMDDAQKARNTRNIMREIFNRGPVCAVFNIFSDFITYWGLQDRQRRVYRLGWDRKGADKTAFEALPRDKQQLGDLAWYKDAQSSSSAGEGGRAPNNPVGISYEELHAVAILGWGESETEGKYWIVRNSWGSTLSDDGTFLIRRGDNHLGIESSVFACWFNTNSASPMKRVPAHKYYWNPLQPLAVREMQVKQRKLMAGIVTFVVLLVVLFVINSRLTVK